MSKLTNLRFDIGSLVFVYWLIKNIPTNTFKELLLVMLLCLLEAIIVSGIITYTLKDLKEWWTE